jgi:hypothetical protein
MSTNVWIRSASNLKAYLRLDGSKVTQFNENGSGIVNAQYYATGTQPTLTPGNDELFVLVPVLNSTAFAIRSYHYPNAYLRLDGSKVTQFNGNGSGIVNAQYYATGAQPTLTPGNDEVFYISAT